MVKRPSALCSCAEQAGIARARSGAILDSFLALCHDRRDICPSGQIPSKPPMVALISR
jgi:hypothetical protein